MDRETVKILLCRGLDLPTMLSYAAEKGWTYPESKIDEWITAAEAELAEEATNLNTETELGKSIARLNYLYMQAVKVQDHKTALSIQKEINKVLTLKVTADAIRNGQAHPSPARGAANSGLRIVGK